MESDSSVLSMTQNLRPLYMDDAPDTTDSPSEFDERIQKSLDEDLLAEEGIQLNGVEEDENGQKITTFLRIRPLSKALLQLDPDSKSKSKDMFKMENQYTVLVNHQLRNKAGRVADHKIESRFKFTKVLGPSESQSSVFEECMHPLLDKFFQGENCLVFSYGATNSGKTFTMHGYGAEFGVLPRTLEFMYYRLEGRLYKKGNIKPNQVDAYFILEDGATERLEAVKQRFIKESYLGSSSRMGLQDTTVVSGHSSKSGLASKQSLPLDAKYSIWISFAEIYNEKVYDLFDKTGKRKEMKLVQNEQGQVYIENLTEYCAHSVDEAQKLFQAGKQSLRHAATNINSNSSRSHSFFNIRMVAVGITGKDVYPKKVLRLTFCDLAGIERVGQTKNVGVRLKESGNINNSLMVFLRCIRAMSDEQNVRASNSRVLPFRERKLTRLFQSYLTTASRICMIANINPDPQILDSSLQVLQNCAVASEVRTYRRVESPENNTQFGPRVRASIALNGSLRINDAHENSQQQSGDESEDDDPDYNFPTVISKNLAFVLKNLQNENNDLKRKVHLIEIQTREDMQKNFGRILAEYDANLNQIRLQERAANQNLNRRRMSLAAKYFTDYPTKCSPIDENSESSPNQNYSANSASSNVTPAEVEVINNNHQDNPQLAWQMPEHKYMEVNDISKNKKMEDLIQRNKELEQMTENFKVKFEKLGQQYQGLEDEITKYKNHVDALNNKLIDAENLCREYHERLDKAPEDRTNELNDLYAENKKQHEDLEMVNVAMLDLKNAKDILARELENAETKIGELRSKMNKKVSRARKKTKKMDSTKSKSSSRKRNRSEMENIPSPDDSFALATVDEEEDDEEEVPVHEWNPKITPNARKSISRPSQIPRSVSVGTFYAGFSPVTDGPSRGRRSLFKKPETIKT